MYKKLFSVLTILSISISTIAQESEDSVEEVITVGTKASLISAIDKQRNSNLIVSVVDSDALGLISEAFMGVQGGKLRTRRELPQNR